MKKKMLFMAALAGAVTLGSCVKDDVSSSVEAVRNAKAQELLGEAAEHNANATLALAQAAVQNAQVAVVNAQAALAKAQAEAAQANADYEKARLADRIDEEVARLKASLQNEKNNLDLALRASATKASDDLAALIGNYQTAFANYSNAQAALIAAQGNYDKALIDESYAKDANAATIKTQQDIIDQQEDLLKALEDVKAKAKTKAEYQAEGDALLAQIDEDIAVFEEENADAIQAFVDASYAWVGAYEAYLAYVDATDGIIAKVNKEATTANPGKPYLITTTATTDFKIIPGLSFGDYDDYTYAGGAQAGGNYSVNNFSAPSYRLSEEGKLLFDPVVNDYAKTAKNNLKKAQDKKALLEAELGKSTDTKDSKYDSDGKGTMKVTLYGDLNDKKAATAKAQAAEDAAKKAVADKPAAVQKALDALVAENSKKIVDDKAWIAAVVTLADAVVDAYGAPAYDPNLKKYATPANDQDAIDYLIGVKNADKLPAKYDKAFMQDPDNVKKLFDSTDATNCIVTAWAADADKKDATEVAKVEDVANRATGAKNVIAEYTAAQGATKAAEAAQKTAQGKVDAQPQKIAAAQDDINDKQEKADNAEAEQAALKALVEAADPKAYNAAVEALESATNDFKAAYMAVASAKADIVKRQTAANAIKGSSPTTVDDKIAAAKTALANAKKALEKLESDNYGQDAIVANMKAALEQAENDVAIAKSELDAATKDLEAAGVEIASNDEPETPATPAEGEGEGESEGEGEEA